MSTLWLLPKWPLPAIDGAMRAHMALLEQWPAEAGPLDLVVFSPQPPPAESLAEMRRLTGAREILILPTLESPRTLRVLSSFIQQSSVPATAMRFNGKAAQRTFQAWSESKSWQNLVIDGIHAAGLFHQAKHHGQSRWHFPKTDTRILRAHNVESDLWEQSAAKATGPMKWVLSREKNLMAAFQDDLLGQCDLTATVSETDAQSFRRRVPTATTLAVPIGFDWPETPRAPSGETRILFVGRLDWPPNSDGLEWFLREVWPQVFAARKDLHLDVVGGFASTRLKSLCAETAGVQAHGLVPDLSDLYQRCALSIIPILTGSGTRVKAIESAKYGRTLLSTAKGIEGVPFVKNKEHLEAETAAEWIEILKNLDLAALESLSVSAFKKGRMSFDRRMIQSRLIAEMKTLSRTSK